MTGRVVALGCLSPAPQRHGPGQLIPIPVPIPIAIPVPANKHSSANPGISSAPQDPHTEQSGQQLRGKAVLMMGWQQLCRSSARGWHGNSCWGSRGIGINPPGFLWIPALPEAPDKPLGRLLFGAQPGWNLTHFSRIQDGFGALSPARTRSWGCLVPLGALALLLGGKGEYSRHDPQPRAGQAQSSRGCDVPSNFTD